MPLKQKHTVTPAKVVLLEEGVDFWIQLPGHVKEGIEKSLKQAKNGQTKTFEEVKKLIFNR